ncbi:cache domain-containing sensor histidine kinase [Cohnella cellulosilytica]|uniref:Sensor histidine kinase n=1 Tax=Cohnella cellulosilytica TaxID=986710 RepID=A0ABW2FKR7_9BACL
MRVFGRRKKESSRLLTRLSVPVFALIVAIVLGFAAAASYLLIRLQNDHTRQMADQSLKFVHRNIRYQFDTMNNAAAYVQSNPSIDGLLESQASAVYDSVDDFFALRANLENLSLLSLLNDFGSGRSVAASYAVSLALRPASGLYAMATDRFDPTPGIYKDDDLQREPWYRDLIGGEKKTVWWGQKTGSSGTEMIYSARMKTSVKDGRDVGIVIVGANIGSLRGAFESASLDKGDHLLLDGNDRVIYGENHEFLEDVGDLPFVVALRGAEGSFVAKIAGEKHRVTFETFENDWKLVTVVPESHYNKYAFAIAAIGAATAAVALSIAGYVFRRIAVRVTVPVTRLVSAMHRPEVLEFKEALPEQRSGIYEVDALGEQFSSMLVALRGLIEKSFAEEMDRKQLQLDLLQARINPHFLYNTLDLINCRAITAGDRESSLIVRSLANFFRYSLNRGETWISLEDEMKQVEAYLDIQRMMMESLRTELRIPETLLSASIVHFAVQPLVENAIVHGFSDDDGDCLIEVSAERQGDDLVLIVRDNGKGCDAAERNRLLRESGGEDRTAHERRRSGYGTLNVHRRIQLHCGEGCGLKYAETDSGTCVEVRLPYRGAEKERSEKEGAADV